MLAHGVWRVGARDMMKVASVAHMSAWNDASDHRTFWWHVAARGGVFRPEILVFCRSRAAGSSGVVRVLKSPAYLRGIEGLSCGSFWARGCMWERVEIPWRMIFLSFVDRSPLNSPVVLVFWSEGQICANFERLFRWSLWVRGRTWEHVDSLLSLIFSRSL